jgi:UDP-N-acetylglucosamine:LPS N-acetylglucosamine transferase
MEKGVLELKKILAISSSGGHWTQLQRVKSAFGVNEVVYVSTLPGYAKEVKENKFYKVIDASQWSKIKLLKLFFQLLKIIYKERPQFIISTGAAPGAFGILLGRLFGAKTIWLDSVANYEKLSLSGNLVKKIIHLHLTQWKHLETKKTQFKGRVL